MKLTLLIETTEKGLNAKIDLDCGTNPEEMHHIRGLGYSAVFLDHASNGIKNILSTLSTEQKQHAVIGAVTAITEQLKEQSNPIYPFNTVVTVDKDKDESK